MKKLFLFNFLLFTTISSYSQLSSFTFDCNTNFFTITADGYIQRWSLSNGAVSGGDTILSGGGTSLAYCGDLNSPTFHTNNWTQAGINYYDTTAGWLYTSTYSYVDNGGGYLNHQYYQVEGAVIQVIKYWDGINLTTVDSLNGEFFAGTHDIAVDSLGRAWVFIGPAPGNVDSLKVYDQNGKLNSYAIQYSQTGYGSFFLNDTLYIGTVEHFIYPVIINAGMAQLGMPIPFPANNFTDMASCQRKETTTSINEHISSKDQLFPNPTIGFIKIPFDVSDSEITVYNSSGKEINIKINHKIIDLSEFPAGIYFIRIENQERTIYQKIMKL